MMIFTSIYSVVDGLFVSNVVGPDALSAISIVMPMMIVVGAFGFMLGTGGSAEVARTLGEGDKQKANGVFTMIILCIVGVGITLSALCVVFMKPLCYALGASDKIIADCVTYGTICCTGMFAFMLQTTFQSFFVTSEKPKLGLVLTVCSGVTNIVLDFLFVYVMKMGIAGAALGTTLSYCVGGIVPLLYFSRKSNKSLLHFTKPKFYKRELLRSCTNGSSEMVSNISGAVVTFLYNNQLMRIAGEQGVAAYTCIMYVNMVFIAILIGFSIGTAPVLGYNYGAQNIPELKNMFRKCLCVVSVVSVVMTIAAELSAPFLLSIFVGHTDELFVMTLRAFRIYSLGFLLCGFNIFASSLFTSLCNGRVSAVISFLRTVVFQAGMILLLPYIIGLDGVWFASLVAEVLSLAVSAFFVIAKRKEYQYI